MVTADRGQAHTLEGIAAALLLLASISFAFQATALVPTSVHEGPGAATNSLDERTDAVLAMSARNGDLRSTVLYWNATEGRFHDAGPMGYYDSRLPPTSFGTLTSEAYENHSVAFSIETTYVTTGGGTETRRMATYGEPGTAAVTTERTVVLTDSDVLRGADESRTETRIDEAPYFIPNAFDGHVYNVVVVEVTVWRI